jgi:hypothetical protein
MIHLASILIITCAQFCQQTALTCTLLYSQNCCSTCRAADAEYAWKKLDGLILHGRKLRVEWATPADFK